MSKKSRRQVAGGSAGYFSTGSTRNEFNPDYSTVKRELKRIAILAGSFLVILVVLSLFQNQILSIFIK